MKEEIKPDHCKIKQLIESDDLNQPVKNGKSRPMLEIEKINFSVLKIITGMENIKENSKVDGFVGRGCHMLQIARIENIAKLIQAGVDVNMPDEDGNTPLIAAINTGSSSLVKMLIKAGADVNMPDRGGKIPLRAAYEIRHREIVLMLLETGKININTNKDIRTTCKIIIWARKTNDIEIAKSLLHIKAISNALSCTDNICLEDIGIILLNLIVPNHLAKPASEPTPAKSFFPYKSHVFYTPTKELYQARSASP